MSNEEKQVDAYLGDIRNHFSTNKVTRREPNKELSWGQFLDGAHTQGQTGLYGTVAAAIAFKSTNAESEEAISVENELVAYWNNKDKPSNHDNLCQNIRLAVLLLGLGFCSKRNPNVIVEISNELSKRFSKSDGLWKDSSTLPGQVPVQLEFSSAIIIIFTFATICRYKGNAQDLGDLTQHVNQAAKALQKCYLNDTKRERPYLLAMLVAVVLVLGKEATGSVAKRLRKCTSNADSIFQRFWYHIDFVDTSRSTKRDYFILPLRLLIPILFLQKQIGVRQYLYATNVLTAIKKVLDSNDSKLFKEQADRPSSLEQAIAILALAASRNESPSESSKALFMPWSTQLWIAKLWIAVNKSRGPEWVFAWILIFTVYIPIGIVLSAGWLLDVAGSALWPSIQLFLEGAKLVPSWIPATVIMFFTALRKPNDMIKTAIVKGTQR